KETRERSIIIGNEAIESDDSDSKRLSYALKDDLLMKCKKVLVKIKAMLNNNNQDYTGSQSKEEKIEHIPQLYPPNKLKFEYNGLNKFLTTKIVSEDEDTQRYYCELINICDNNENSSDNNNYNNYNVVYHEIIDMNTLKNTLWKIDTKEKLIPGLGGKYKVRVSAMANNCKNSESKYADEVIFRMSPPVSVGFTHSYDNNIDYLGISVENTKDQQPSLGYTYQVYQVINKEDNVIYTSPTNDLPNLNLDKIRNSSEDLISEHFIRVKDIATEESNWMDS
ncbi:16864_t:CDS:1, partial [Dentiscutata heterogama]